MARDNRNKQARQTIALVGDGQTERIYFANVRDTDRPKNLSIFPDYPRKIGSYKGVLDRAHHLVGEGYDQVYALIDMDKIIDENRLAEYRHNKTIAEQAGIRVLENNPCFEIWILLHFVQTGRLFANCGEVVTALRRIESFENYDKSERFLTAAKLYERNKAQLTQSAITNARLLENNRDDYDERYPRAETFRFFEWYFNQ